MRDSKKWTEFYNSEEELIDDMLLAFTDTNTAYYYKLVKGYEYIGSFQKYYKKNGCLTEKQMTQLKRLAGEVYHNVHDILKYNYTVRMCKLSVIKGGIYEEHKC